MGLAEAGIGLLLMSMMEFGDAGQRFVLLQWSRIHLIKIAVLKVNQSLLARHEHITEWSVPPGSGCRYMMILHSFAMASF